MQEMSYKTYLNTYLYRNINLPYLSKNYENVSETAFYTFVWGFVVLFWFWSL